MAHRLFRNSLTSLLTAATLCLSPLGIADETCYSPYMAKIVGQEDFMYIWTLGGPGCR